MSQQLICILSVVCTAKEVRARTSKVGVCRSGQALRNRAAAAGLVYGVAGGVRHFQQGLGLGGREVVNDHHFSTVEDGQLLCTLLSGC